jgi:D-sedoheptulose 7-phosphate isomerase
MKSDGPNRGSLNGAIEISMAARAEAGAALAADAERIARACQAMALRFHRGGKLLVFGNGGAGTDARHVAVEFVHPVIVGKRALPALALNNDAAAGSGCPGEDVFGGVFARQLRLLAAPQDIAMGISVDGECSSILRAFETARGLGLLTVALCGNGGGAIARRGDLVDWRLLVHSSDPLIVKEIQVTTYHILWELVHVFFEHAGMTSPGATR